MCGRVLFGILDWGLLLCSPNPDPISDQNRSFSTPVFRPECKDDVLKMFDALCGRVTVSALDGIVQFEDISTTSIMNTHWSKAETWCQWWTQERHLKLLCEATADMSATVWETTPFTTNAVRV